MTTKLLDEGFYPCRFIPEQTETVAYFLPRLVSGEPMQHGAGHLIHCADVHCYEPKDIAALFAPVPKPENTGDPFFTPCKWQNWRGNVSVRVAGAENWTVQKTAQINNGLGVNVGEKQTLSFKKDGELAGWLMEEYRSACKKPSTTNASQATRQESAAHIGQEDEEAEPAHPPETVSTPSPKRLAPVAADEQCHCPKRARVTVPSPTVVQHQQDYFASIARPLASLPAAVAGSTDAAEADDDLDLFRCALAELLDCFGALEEEQTQPSLDEILGVPVPEQQAVWTIDQEPSIAAEEEKCSWALLQSYKQRPIFRLDQLDGYQEFVSYTLNLDR